MRRFFFFQAAGLTHLGFGVLLTIYWDAAILIVDYGVYTLCVIFLYIEASLLLMLSLSELCFDCRKKRKKVITVKTLTHT